MWAWSPKGFMYADILKDVVVTLNNLDVFDCSNSINLVLLLDGHGSDMNVPFL